MGKKFDVAAFAIVGRWLRDTETPLEMRPFKVAIDRLISSIEGLGKTPAQFAETHGNPKDPLWKVASRLAGKTVQCSDHTYTELRELRNRLKRIKFSLERWEDVQIIVDLYEYVCESLIFADIPNEHGGAVDMVENP